MENPLNARFSGKYLRFLLKKNRTLIIILTLAMLFANPILILINYRSWNNIDFLVPLTLVLTSIVLVLASVLIPPVTLSYLNSKKALDVYYALPMKRINLFFTQFMSILISIWIPFILATLSGYLISGLLGYFNATVLSNLPLLLLFYLFLFLMSSFLIALSSFVCVNTGTTLNAYLYIGIISAVPFILYIAVGLFSSMYLGSYFTLSTDIIKFSSPIYALFENLSFYLNNILTSTDFYTIFDLLKPMAYWFVGFLLVLFAAIALFQRREQEFAEHPFTNSWFGPIVLSISTMAFLFMLLTSFRTTNDYTSVFTIEGLVLPLLFTYIVFIIGIAITNKNFKNIVRYSLQYVVIGAVTVSIFAVGIKTGGFGYLYTVPSIDKVTGVTISYSDYNDVNVSNVIVSSTDGDNLQKVIAIHQYIVDNLQNETSLNNGSLTAYESTNTFLTFFYTIPGENDYSISYRLYLNDSSLLNKLLEIDSFKNAINPILDTSKVIDSMTVVNRDFIADDLSTLTATQFREISEAISLDRKDIGDLEFVDDEILFQYQLIYTMKYGQQAYDGYLTYTIDNRYSHTLALLDQLDLTFDQEFSSSPYSNLPNYFNILLIDPSGTTTSLDKLFTKNDLDIYSLTKCYTEDTDQLNTSMISYEDFQKLSPYLLGDGQVSTEHRKVYLYDTYTGNSRGFIISDEAASIFDEVFAKGERALLSPYESYSIISNTKE